MPNTMTDVFLAFFAELEKIAVSTSSSSSSEKTFSGHGGHIFGRDIVSDKMQASYDEAYARAEAQDHPHPYRVAERAAGRHPLVKEFERLHGGKITWLDTGPSEGIFRVRGFTPTDPSEKKGEIMPSPSEHLKRTAGSPIPRGPRMKAGGRVGTTTAHPFSGNKAKVAGMAPLAVGAVAGAGAVGAYKTFKQPFLDYEFADEPEERLSHPITPSRTRYSALQNPLGPLRPRRVG